jgi:hypothetical protein
LPLVCSLTALATARARRVLAHPARAGQRDEAFLVQASDKITDGFRPPEERRGGLGDGTAPTSLLTKARSGNVTLRGDERIHVFGSVQVFQPAETELDEPGSDGQLFDDELGRRARQENLTAVGGGP